MLFELVVPVAIIFAGSFVFWLIVFSTPSLWSRFAEDTATDEKESRQ